MLSSTIVRGYLCITKSYVSMVCTDLEALYLVLIGRQVMYFHDDVWVSKHHLMKTSLGYRVLFFNDICRGSSSIL